VVLRLLLAQPVLLLRKLVQMAATGVPAVVAAGPASTQPSQQLPSQPVPPARGTTSPQPAPRCVQQLQLNSQPGSKQQHTWSVLD
jgi:hypothetical protein